MNKKLVSIVAGLLLGASGAVVAQTSGGAAGATEANGAGSAASTYSTNNTNNYSDSSVNRDSGQSSANAERSVALNNGASANFSNAFNVTHATATGNLSGAVSGNTVMYIGNAVNNTGDPAGGSGTNHVGAGNFSMANTLSGAAQSAAGILVLAQQGGVTGMVQQSVSVQANVNMP